MGVDHAETRGEEYRQTAEKSMRTLVAFLILILCVWSCLAGKWEDPHKYVLAESRMDYPYYARLHKITGSGVFVIDISPNGLVKTVRAGQSTGSPILDAAAIQSLMKWRFRPGSPPRVKIPIAFSLPGTLR